MRLNEVPISPRPEINEVVKGQKFNPCKGCIKKCDPDYAKYCKARIQYDYKNPNRQ